MTGLILISLSAILAGLNLAALKLALAELSPPLLMFVRFFLATVFLWVLFKPKFKRDVLLISSLSAFSLMFIILGLNLSTVSNVQIILAFIPLGVGFAGHFFLGEKQSAKSLGGLLLGLFGAAVIIFSARITGSNGHALTFGNGLVFLATVFNSAYIILCRKISQSTPTKTVVFNQFAATSFLFFVLCLIFYFSGIPLVVSAPTLTSFWAIFYLVVFGTVAMFLFSQEGLKRTSAYILGMSQYLQIPVGVFAGVVFFADRISAVFILGAGLILLGSILGAREHLRRAKRIEVIEETERV